MKIGFHSNQLSLTGTEIALFDYAHHNEQELGHKSVIFYQILFSNHLTKNDIVSLSHHRLSTRQLGSVVLQRHVSKKALQSYKKTKQEALWSTQKTAPEHIKL